MKIALVHMRHAYAGGTELFINQLAPVLVARGHEVTVICRSHEDPPHPEVNFVTLNSLALGKGHRMWRFAKDVEAYLNNHEFDLVFGLGKTWSHDVIRIGGGTHKSFQLSTYGRERWRLKDIITRAIEKRALADSAFMHLIANSHKTHDELIKDHQVNAEKISIIHNAVDTRRFSAAHHRPQALELRRTLGISDGAYVYLFLGSGYQRKGLDTTLKAFAKVLDSHPDSKLLIVGYDNQAASYQRLATELTIAPHCHFLGGRRDPEVCYSAADCYVLPTRYEPFGYSVIEALASGLPVVTSRQCGASEVVNSQVASVLDADAPISDWGRALAEWQDPSRGDADTKRQRAQALSIDSIMQANAELLEKLAQQKASFQPQEQD